MWYFRDVPLKPFIVGFFFFKRMMTNKVKTSKLVNLKENYSILTISRDLSQCTVVGDVKMLQLFYSVDKVFFHISFTFFFFFASFKLGFYLNDFHFKTIISLHFSYFVFQFSSFSLRAKIFFLSENKIEMKLRRDSLTP